MARRENDFYPTPARATEVLIENCLAFYGHTIWEPCAGDGAIADVFRPYGRVVTSDIDPAMDCDFYADARTAIFEDCVPFNMEDAPLAAVTNPPFLVAFEILLNLFKQNIPIALLLRLSFLEPTEDPKRPNKMHRGPWLANHPPDGLIVLPRISFTGDGKTDSVTCAWMCWNVEPFQTIIVPKSEFKK